MSYEGYVEWLCISGHYDTNTQWEKSRLLCRFCNNPLVYYHDVDETNGEIRKGQPNPYGYYDLTDGCYELYEKDDPSTYDAEKEEIGFDDAWHEDHYGNKYAIKILKYKPKAINEFQECDPAKWTRFDSSQIDDEENHDPES